MSAEAGKQKCAESSLGDLFLDHGACAASLSLLVGLVFSACIGHGLLFFCSVHVACVFVCVCAGVLKGARSLTYISFLLSSNFTQH